MQGSAQSSSIKLQEKSLSSQSSALGTFLHLKQTPHCTSPKGFSSSNSSPTKTVGPKACFFFNTSRILMLGCAFSVCAICAMNPLSFFLPDLSLGGSFNPASSFFFFLSWYCFFRPEDERLGSDIVFFDVENACNCSLVTLCWIFVVEYNESPKW